MPARRSLLAAPFLLLAPAARAQDWKPDRPMRLVVPFAPGGAQDVVGRFSTTLG
jgi:tripartite-type tricarboxylate transporter receptor subunit TctC